MVIDYYDQIPDEQYSKVFQKGTHKTREEAVERSGEFVKYLIQLRNNKLAALPKLVRSESAAARCEAGIISHLSTDRSLVFGLESEVLRLLSPVSCILSPFFYFPASIFLFIRVAVTAAEKPPSILTTLTPAAQLLSIVKSADSPSKLEP